MREVLRGGGSNYRERLPLLLEKADELELAVGPIAPVFGHNDLLPANFIDDGSRLWLVDWDYAGFNSALFDLGGLAANCQLETGARNLPARAVFWQPTRCIPVARPIAR